MLSTREVRRREKLPISDVELEAVGDFPVELESEIRGWQSFSPGLLKNGVVVLLHDKRDIGHFVCMFQRGDEVTYFDSFGAKPPASLRRLVNFTDVNTVDYQDKDTSTCGKHCALRLAKQDLSNEQYYEWFKGVVQELKANPDAIVTQIYAGAKQEEFS
jgi:hypothetical protein